MKNLKLYIQEGFKIGKTKGKTYTCQPKDTEELRKIIKERLKEDRNADFNDIDTSLITDMSYLFNREFPHNIDISGWDTSNVEDMSNMFFWAHDFNCDLSNWDVSKVKYMNNMFDECHKFEGKGLEKWRTDSLTSTYRMFYECENFDCDVSNWNMKNAKKIDVMFYGCKKFKGKGLENWKLNSLKGSISDIFWGCTSLSKKPSWYKKYY